MYVKGRVLSRGYVVGAAFAGRGEVAMRAGLGLPRGLACAWRS